MLRVAIRLFALFVMVCAVAVLVASRWQTAREVEMARAEFKRAVAETDHQLRRVEVLEGRLRALSTNSAEVEIAIRREFRMVRPRERLMLVRSGDDPIAVAAPREH